MIQKQLNVLKPVKPFSQTTNYIKGKKFLTSDNKPEGLVQIGNLDIINRPIIHNSDGTHSSEYSISFGDELGREILVPTVVNGKFLTPDGKKPLEGSEAEKQMFQRAFEHYNKTKEHLGIFDNYKNADKYAIQLHSRKQAGIK